MFEVLVFQSGRWRPEFFSAIYPSNHELFRFAGEIPNAKTLDDAQSRIEEFLKLRGYEPVGDWEYFSTRQRKLLFRKAEKRDSVKRTETGLRTSG